MNIRRSDYPLRLMISENEIKARILEMSKGFNEKYEELVLVMIMKGSICFVADLLRHLHVKVSIEYVHSSSYRGTTARGDLETGGMGNFNIEGKNVLIVDDIFDSGLTMDTIYKELLKQNPKTLESLVLLNKKAERKTDYEPDHSAFEIENEFVVGYGLDYEEHYRGLPGIFVIEA
jgi:hypoxanthine phosphoribosyltransferase